jgi:hypothetical protein
MSPLGIILLVVLLIVLLGGTGQVGLPYGYGLGHGGIGIIGVLIIILVVMALTGRLG